MVFFPRHCLAGATILLLSLPCLAATTPAIGVTDTKATLTGLGSCTASTPAVPCTAWFQYWAEGQPQPTITATQLDAVMPNNKPLQQALSGLQANSVYHYQICGYGGAALPKPGTCRGYADGGYLTYPGYYTPYLPTFPGSAVQTYNLSAEVNFRTANPKANPKLGAVVDLGRIRSVADVPYYGSDLGTPGGISRDTGYSVAYSATPAASLWLFGDTGFGCQPDPATMNCRFTIGATAAAGPFVAGQAPTALVDLPAGGVASPAAPTQPTSFFPTPPILQFNDNGAVVTCLPSFARGSIAGTTLTVTSAISGTFQVGELVAGTGIAPGTTITQVLSGSGQVGTYAVSPSQNAASTFLKASFGLNTYGAQWAGGGAAEPGTNKVVLSYTDVCVHEDGGVETPERLHLLEYSPTTNLFTNVATPYVAIPLTAGMPPKELLTSPVFGKDGYLYWYSFSSVCTANPKCLRPAPYPNAVYAARVSTAPAQWKRATNYQWWGLTGSGTYGWTSEGRATSIVTFPGNMQPFGIQVADYSAYTSHHFVLMVETTYDSPGKPVQFAAFESATAYGPFKLDVAGAVPDTCPLNVGCYAVFGHPELSTNTQLAFSWFSSGDRLNSYAVPLNGHLRLGGIAW